MYLITFRVYAWSLSIAIALTAIAAVVSGIPGWSAVGVVFFPGMVIASLVFREGVHSKRRRVSFVGGLLEQLSICFSGDVVVEANRASAKGKRVRETSNETSGDDGCHIVERVPCSRAELGSRTVPKRAAFVRKWKAVGCGEELCGNHTRSSCERRRTNVPWTNPLQRGEVRRSDRSVREGSGAAVTAYLSRRRSLQRLPSRRN